MIRKVTCSVVMRIMVLWLIVWAVVSPMASSAQSEKFTITAGKTRLLIGEHAILTLNLEADRMTRVQWPRISDTLAGGLHLLFQGDVDSTLMTDGLVRYVQTWVVSAYDSGSYTIQGLHAELISGDPGQPVILTASPLTIHFGMPKVNLEEPLRDIAGPLNVPFGWQDLLRWLAYLLPGLLVLFLLYRYLVRLRNRKSTREQHLPIFNEKAPWEIATGALLALRQSNVLWVNGIKAYYVLLTDILRVYISDGLNVDAPEYTTAQTLAALRQQPSVPAASLEDLAAILRLGDLVKFATYHPAQSVSDEMLERALSFVKSTAPAHLTENDKEEQS